MAMTNLELRKHQSSRSSKIVSSSGHYQTKLQRFSGFSSIDAISLALLERPHQSLNMNELVEATESTLDWADNEYGDDTSESPEPISEDPFRDQNGQCRIKSDRAFKKARTPYDDFVTCPVRLCDNGEREGIQNGEEARRLNHASPRSHFDPEARHFFHRHAKAHASEQSTNPREVGSPLAPSTVDRITPSSPVHDANPASSELCHSLGEYQTLLLGFPPAEEDSTRMGDSSLQNRHEACIPNDQVVGNRLAEYYSSSPCSGLAMSPPRIGYVRNASSMSSSSNARDGRVQGLNASSVIATLSGAVTQEMTTPAQSGTRHVKTGRHRRNRHSLGEFEAIRGDVSNNIQWSVAEDPLVAYLSESLSNHCHRRTASVGEEDKKIRSAPTASATPPKQVLLSNNVERENLSISQATSFASAISITPPDVLYLGQSTSRHVVRLVLVDSCGHSGEYTGMIRINCGLPHGQGLMTYHLKEQQVQVQDSNGPSPNSRCRYYRGEWESGKWNGYGKAKFANGCTYEGHYHMDQRHGWGIFSWPDGRRFEGMYKADMRNGQGRMLWPDGAVYEGGFVNGRREGYGVFRSTPQICGGTAGKIYAGEWRKGQFCGQPDIPSRSMRPGMYKTACRSFEELARTTSHTALRGRTRSESHVAHDDCKIIRVGSCDSSAIIARAYSQDDELDDNAAISRPSHVRFRAQSVSSAAESSVPLLSVDRASTRKIFRW